MTFNHIIRNARIHGLERTVDVGIIDGLIAGIAPNLDFSGEECDARGGLLFPGFVETHIHLDKSCILHATGASHPNLAAAVHSVAVAKRDFSLEDIVSRASQTIERAIAMGTNRLRTHVEVDPRIGLTGFEAMKIVRDKYAWAADVQICVFPQEGLIDDPGCRSVLVEALETGADLIGGAPYMDNDPDEHVRLIFELAREFDVDVDFHLDFDLDVNKCQFVEVCRMAKAFGWKGRVTIGHASKIALLDNARLADALAMLADSGVAVTGLPATDLYLLGRELGVSAPRIVLPLREFTMAGVNFSLSTNNILNPFTPYGDASLTRIGNLHANIAQLGNDVDMNMIFEAVADRAARMIGDSNYSIAVGSPATFVVLDCESREQAIRQLAVPRFGFKNGEMTFSRQAAELHSPIC